MQTRLNFRALSRALPVALALLASPCAQAGGEISPNFRGEDDMHVSFAETGLLAFRAGPGVFNNLSPSWSSPSESFVAPVYSPSFVSFDRSGDGANGERFTMTTGAAPSAPDVILASATWSATPTNGNWVPAGGETNWSTGAGNFPGATSGLTNSDTATFPATSTQTSITINSATLNIRSITFTGTSAVAYTIGSTGGNSLLLTSGGTISIASTVTGANNADTINAPLVLEPASASTAGTYTFSSASGTASHPLIIGGTVMGGTTTQGITLTLEGGNTGANTISGVISDGGAAGGLSIIKDANGTWILSGNNSYTGGTTINAGILRAGSTTALGSAADATLTFGSGSTGRFQLFGFNTTVVGLNSNSTVGTPIVENGAAGTATLTVDGTGVNAFAGVLQNGTAGTLALTKSGTGTLTLRGTNTYTGDTQINGGDLRFDAGGTANGSTIRLGDTSGSNYAVLSLGVGSGNNIGSTLDVRSGSSGTKVLRSLNGSGTNTYSGGITLNTGLTLEATTDGTLLLQGGSLNLQTNTLTIDSQVVNAGTGPNGADSVAMRGIVRINEVISGSGGSIVKDGSGILILEGVSNTYTGGTTIKGGTVGIFGDGSLGTAPGAATNNVFFAASSASNPTATRTLRADAAGITLAATRDISIASGVTGTLDSNGNTFTIGGIINGAGNLNKAGTGTLVLTGANTYTGSTTISSGILNPAVTGALGGTSGITVNNGGTLLVTGSGNLNRINNSAPIVLGGGGGADPIFARSGAGTVSEGVGATSTGGVPSGTSTAGLGALSLQSNATFDFGSGGVGTFVFTSFTANGNTLDILNWTSNASFTGLVSGVDGTDDRLIFGGGTPPNVAFITFNGTPAAFIPLDTGFYELVPVPEPSTWIGGALALLAVGWTQRKRFGKRLPVIS